MVSELRTDCPKDGTQAATGAPVNARECVRTP